MQTAGGRVKSEMRLFFCKGRRQRGLGVILRPRLCRARRDILHRRQQRAYSLLRDALKQLAGGLVLPISTGETRRISPVSRPSFKYIMETPVVFSPLITAHCTGAAPRYLEAMKRAD